MALSRLIGIFALIVQIANAGSFFIEMLPADIAIVVAGIVAAIQAFTVQVQGASRR